jgi:hypothetical protein
MNNQSFEIEQRIIEVFMEHETPPDEVIATLLGLAVMCMKEMPEIIF